MVWMMGRGYARLKILFVGLNLCEFSAVEFEGELAGKSLLSCGLRA